VTFIIQKGGKAYRIMKLLCSAFVVIRRSVCLSKVESWNRSRAK
jgi:hypothetical protein